MEHPPIEVLYARLHSNAGGLSQGEAAQRLARYGANRIEQVRAGSPLFAFLKEFSHFFALILWLAAALAFFAEWKNPGQQMAVLGYAILAVILVNGIFSFWQGYRAEKALAALRQLLPKTTTALRSGRIIKLPVVNLVPGDVVLLAAGDDVPADCRLIEGNGVRVNASNLTGESIPVARYAPLSGNAHHLSAQEILHAGTSLISGNAKAIVYATGMHTEFGNIARLSQASREPLSPLQKEIARLSWFIAVLSFMLGALFFLIGQGSGLSFPESLLFAIGILVANVPEGLLPAVTLSLAMATQRMAKKRALVRHLPAVETLGAASVICTDKTGTLTENRMSLNKLYISFADYRPRDLPQQEAATLYDIMRHCHDLRRVDQAGTSRWQGDPLEIALLECVPEGGEIYPRVSEMPFDSERMRMSVVCRTPSGFSVYCKGALQSVLPLCDSVLQQGGGVGGLDHAATQRIMKAEAEMTAGGLRVLALAFRQLPQQPVDAENKMVFAGLAGLRDPPRKEVPQAMRICHAAGIRVIMITGDHPQTAAALAGEIGLAQQPRTVTGDRLQQMSGVELDWLLHEPELIFARTSAEQKMRIVQALQRKGEVVAVTGDGVNDAPALRVADVGIAMGVAGTDVARESADIILLDDNFATIVSAIEEGRAVFDNLRKFLTYILTSNIPELVPYLAYVLFSIPLPLTILQMLAIDLGTDMLPALALGAEQPDPATMQRQPRPKTERLLTWGMLWRAYFFLGPLEAIAGMALFFLVLHGGGWRYGEATGRHELLYLQATTACLAAIIAMQVVNVFMCRHPVMSSLAGGHPPNRLIWYGIAFELFLTMLIVYTPWGNLLFATAPLSAVTWLWMAPFMLGMLLLEELRKAVISKGNSTSSPVARTSF